MTYRSMTPDWRMEIDLAGTATRLAVENAHDADAVTELKFLAQGRADLLAEAAGGLLGAWLASPGTQHPNRVRGAWPLIAAGADPTAIARWTDEARAQMQQSTHGTHGGVEKPDEA